MLTKQFFETTRGRLVTLLRRSGLTIDEMAGELGITPAAVRAQITAMQRDGLVRRGGQRRGTTRPPHVYEITEDVEQLLSRAYIPLMTHVLHAVVANLSRREVETVMRRAGKAVAGELMRGKRPMGNLPARIAAASGLLNDELGALTRVDHNGSYRIVGAGCPLAALTGKHPAVCLAVESLLQEVVEAPASECCDRTGRPRCCFQFADEEPKFRA
jgi:DeoR family transcriptional regulator, suf operon transcriptional repressor